MCFVILYLKHEKVEFGKSIIYYENNAILFHGIECWTSKENHIIEKNVVHSIRNIKG